MYIVYKISNFFVDINVFFFYGMMYNDYMIIVLVIKYWLMKICIYICKYLFDIYNIIKVGFKKEI